MLAILRKLPFYSKLIDIYARITTRMFHVLYYLLGKQTWKNTYWFGTPLLKCPLDLWIYQEILHEVKPDVIIECGTHQGGSALYLANLLDLMGKGRIYTVDIKRLDGQPEHPRINYVVGSSVDDDVISSVRKQINDGEVVMVILDSDHRKPHVLQELKKYAEIVTVGSYMIVEDSNLNGHPIFKAYGPGPMEAIDEFFRSTDSQNYKIDKSKEKFFLTFNPRGYLKRVS